MPSEPTASIPVALPRGPHGLEPEVVRESQRLRAIDAMTRAVAEKGYAVVAVADVVSMAGVSRRTFYELFVNKEDCFLAAYDAAMQHFLVAFAERTRTTADGGWNVRLDAALADTLEALAAQPDRARLYYLEVLNAGARALERRAATMHQIVSALQALLSQSRAAEPNLRHVSDQVLFAFVAGAQELAAESIRTRGTDSLPQLKPALLDLATSVLSRPGTSRD